MQIVLWIVIGLLGGLCASYVLGKTTKNDLRNNGALGVIGALDGGSLLHILGIDSTSQFTPFEISIIVGSALLVILIAKVMRSI